MDGQLADWRSAPWRGVEINLGEGVIHPGQNLACKLCAQADGRGIVSHGSPRLPGRAYERLRRQSSF